MRLRRAWRGGATVVQFAVAASTFFIFLIGLLVGGLGIFRYHQVAFLAREASRYASVHGAQYAATTKNTAATATDIYNNVIAPSATGLNLNNLTYSVTWNTSNAQFHTVSGSKVANTVTVTVKYKWVPEAYLGGIMFSSTSVCVMSF